MGHEYARTDLSNGIQRKTISKAICNCFASAGHKKTMISLLGNSGVGKSYLCKSILNSDLIVPQARKALVDFNLIANNNIPGIIQNIIIKFGLGRFLETQTLLDKYFKSTDASKTECLEKCVDAFIVELNDHANICDGILLIFDTVEALSLNTEMVGFKRILKMTNENVHFLFAGIEAVDLCTCITFPVSGFNETEIEEYLISRNSRMKAVFRKHGTLLASQIRKYTDDGNPILCGLVSDWLLRCSDLTEQIDYLLSLKESSRMQLIKWMSKLDNDLFTAFRLTAFFNDRMTAELLESMSNMSVSQAKSCLQKMTSFSFVKLFSDELDQVPQIVLHDIVAELIRNSFPYSTEELHFFAKQAVQAYDQMILEDRSNAEAFRLEQSLRVEKVMCFVRYGTYDEALAMFDNEVIDGIDVFDYSFVAQLISEVEAYLKTTSAGSVDQISEDEKVKWEYMLQIANAEVKLSKYRAEEALIIYEQLKAAVLNKTTFYKALADDLYARILVNPCTVDCSEAPSDAIKIMNSTIKVISKSQLSRRLTKSFYWLGNAYVRCGQNDKAQKAYEAALSKSQTDVQKVLILLDMSKMIRLQQDLSKALFPLQKCDALMENMKKNKGKYHYYKGNVYRDLDDIETATIYYNMAFQELADGADNFTLCELNLDFAWLHYIRNDTENIDIDAVRKYLDEGWNHAERHCFGTEYSEYHHILYEILNYLGERNEAYIHLEKAISFAYQYSNIYMILDCLNHQVQRYYQEKRFSLVPGVIEEMERIEKQGCKIRVFRGRARLVQADIYFDNGNYAKALQEYFDGFVTVALYGNSRTNVELFEDLFNKTEGGARSRREKMIECINTIAEPAKYRRKFRQAWRSKNIDPEYDYFLDVLKKRL